MFTNAYLGIDEQADCHGDDQNLGRLSVELGIIHPR